jgi:predicted Zn-dependent protease
VVHVTPDFPLTDPDSGIAGGAKNRVEPASPSSASFFQEQTNGQEKKRLLLHPGIAQQVGQRLRSKPASSTAVLQLITLLDCVASAPTQCSYAAPYATSWALAAADNALLAPEPRRNLLVRAVDVQLAAKNYVAAMRLAFVGIAHTPHDATYRIMAADALLFLDRCAEAKGQLQNILENDDSADEDKSTARRLLLKARKREHCRDSSSSAHSIRPVTDISRL